MADSDTAATRKIQVALARYAPALVRVERSDHADPTTIKPTGKRGRWQRVLDSVPDDAVRVELLDKSQAVLWSQDLTAPEDASKRVTEADQLFQLVQHAQDTAQRRAHEYAEQMHKSFLSVITVLTERLTHLEANYSSVLQMAADSAARPPGDASEQDQQNAAMLNQVLKHAMPQLAEKFLPKNGAKK